MVAYVGSSVDYDVLFWMLLEQVIKKFMLKEVIRACYDVAYTILSLMQVQTLISTQMTEAVKAHSPTLPLPLSLAPKSNSYENDSACLRPGRMA